MPDRLGALLLLLAVLLCSLLACSVPPEARTQEIIVLFTNDIHCAMDENIGFAGLAAYRNACKEKTPYVTLVDCGDAIQGSTLGAVSRGRYAVTLMNEIGYDFAVLGNHEFDFGMECLSEHMKNAKAQYLGCNIRYTGDGETALDSLKPYDIISYGETDVAFIGVSTPESTVSSTPSYFMEDGSFVYDFYAGEDGSLLYACVQGYVDECRSLGADYVILLTHLGDEESASPYTSVELIEHTQGVDAVLDGHAHHEIPCSVKPNKAGKEALLSSTGTGMENIGQLTISAAGNLTVGLISEYAAKDTQMQGSIAAVKGQYEERMLQTVAKSDCALSCYEGDARLVRNRETAIGNFCADAYRAVSGADIAFLNGGGIRADLPKGNISYADLIAVNPFGNTLCMVEVTGQEIVDALEFACRLTEKQAAENGKAVGEFGGFLQVSGLRFTIDTSIDSSVITDNNGMFVSVGEGRRVKNIMVLGCDGSYAPIELDGTYKVASHNYLIKSMGDGYTMFADKQLLIDEGMQDYQILITYMTEILGGAVSEKYAATEGRITVKQDHSKVK